MTPKEPITERQLAVLIDFKNTGLNPIQWLFDQVSDIGRIIVKRANYCGIVPGANQSSDSETKGLRMTKAGLAIMRWALFQAGHIGRSHDPQLACVYYREMVHNGKNHMQAMGAVMSHMSARVLAVLREDKPYELLDIDGNSVSREEARKIILAKYQVPEEIRKERRRRKTLGNFKLQKKLREMLVPRAYEAATAPQPAVT